MSIRIMNLVWSSDFDSHSKKLVLLALADNANDEGDCWPAVATIAKKASVSERWVSTCIMELEKLGWLRIFKRRGNSNYYRITPPTHFTPEPTSPLNPLPITPEVGSTTTLNPLPITPEPTSPKSSLTINEPSEEPSQQKSRYSESFERFWSVCPRRVDKSEAFKAFEKSCKKICPDVLCERMAAYANQCQIKQTEIKFIKHPATWLNKGSWEDDLDFSIPKPQESKPDYFRDTVMTGIKTAMGA